MKSKINFFIRFFLLGCLIPITVSTMVYEGFTTNYTRYVFSQRGFENQYNNGIYKYRVLGRVMLLKTYQMIRRYELPTIRPRFLHLLDENADRRFYSAYFYLNTVFLCLTCLVLFFVLGGHNNQKFTLVDLPIIAMCLLMGITQYIVAPYDTLSYFFLASAAFLIMGSKQTLWNILALCVVIVLATLTRETSALILAFYVAVNYKTILAIPMFLKISRPQGELLILSICYISTYVGLRYIFSDVNVIYQEFRVLENINPFSLLSVLFFCAIAIIVSITQPITKNIFVLYIVSLPYTLSILLIAEPWEARLWIPIILLVLILKIKAVEVDENTRQKFAS